MTFLTTSGPDPTVRFGIDMVSILIVVFGLYLRRDRDKERVMAAALLNIFAFGVLAILGAVVFLVAAAFGPFATLVLFALQSKPIIMIDHGTLQTQPGCVPICLNVRGSRSCRTRSPPLNSSRFLIAQRPLARGQILDPRIAKNQSTFDTICVEGLNNNAAMLERLDQKSIIPTDRLGSFFVSFRDLFEVPDITGKRPFSHATRYFEAAAQRGYCDHHLGRRKRCKAQPRNQPTRVELGSIPCDRCLGITRAAFAWPQKSGIIRATDNRNTCPDIRRQRKVERHASRCRSDPIGQDGVAVDLCCG